MLLNDEVASSLYFLSTFSDQNAIQEVYTELSQKVSYIPDGYREYYSYYCDYYRNYECFPDWQQFTYTCQIENQPQMSTKAAHQIYLRLIQIWESQYLSSRLSEVPLSERRVYLERLSRCLELVDSDESELSSTDSFSVEGSFILDELDNSEGFRFPIKKLNEISVVRPGTMIVVSAHGGAGKTTFALNCVYQNSIRDSKKTLYIYCENSERAYQAELRSRYSYDSGQNIENRSLHQGVIKEDSSAVEAILKLDSEFKANTKGKVYFKSFAEYPTDPLKFGAALARDINRYDIDNVVFDYIQKVKAFVPLRMDSNGYINQICSTLTSVALGGFEAKPTSLIVLAQPNRDAINKAMRTKGNSYNLSSLAEASSLERDAFLVIFLYSDEESKAANQIYFKVAKNRNGEGMVSMMPATFVPQYCLIGDVGSNDDDSQIYNSSSMLELFDLDI